MPNAPINYRAMLQDALEASDLGQVKGIITPEGRQRSRATEHPDLWSLLEIKEGQQVGYKVLASYCGGYLGGDAWRFSTRVVRVEDAGHALAIHGMSGSVYLCRKGSYGTHSLAESVLVEARDAYPDIVRLMEEAEALTALSDLGDRDDA